MSRNRRRAAPVIQPDNVQGLWNARTMYYRSQLHLIVKGLFDVTLPDLWDETYVMDLLTIEGVFAITDTAAGLLPFRTSFAGNNYMNQPVMTVISVPHFPQMNRKIGVNSEIVFLQRSRGMYGFYNFNGVLDIFAEKLASADAAIDVNLMNSRVAYIVEAETKAQAETIKEAYSDVTAGKPMVVVRKGSVDSKLVSQGLMAFFNNVRGNFIAGDVQDVKRTIMNEFLTALGINNANTDKKERLVTGEVDSNNVELACNINAFRRVLKRQIDRVHKLYPELKSEFNIEFKFDPEKLAEEARRLANASLGTNQHMGNESSPGKVRR